MRTLFVKIAAFVCRGVYRLYSYPSALRMRDFRDKMYTFWIKNHIGSLGEHSTICFPCLIQGGGNRNIHIGSHTIIQRYGTMECISTYQNQTFSPAIEIGNHCHIGEYNHLTSINRIVIGDNLLTGRFVVISDNAHGGLSETEKDIAPASRKLISKGETVIGNNVWIGDKVTILPGVHIGHNVIIAANAVVTKDLPSDCIAAGIPAKVIRSINDEA